MLNSSLIYVFGRTACSSEPCDEGRRRRRSTYASSVFWLRQIRGSTAGTFHPSTNEELCSKFVHWKSKHGGRRTSQLRLWGVGVCWRRPAAMVGAD